MAIYNAVFRIDQYRPGLSQGEAGISRRDLWLDKELRLVPTSPPAATDTTYLWEFLDKPSASTVEFLDADSSNPDPTAEVVKFTPDQWGTYRIRLTINGGQFTHTMLAAVILSDAGALTNRGWRIPSFQETNTEANFPGQARGYADDYDFIFNDLLVATAAGFTAGGDLDGTNSNQTVVGVRGNPVEDATPSVGDSLVWDGTKFAIQPVLDDTNQLVFHPGGTADDNVYTNWALLMAAFANTEGIVVIMVEDADDAAVIPGGTWDLEDRGIIAGTVRGDVTDLTIGDGTATILRNPAGFRNINLTNAVDGYIDASPGALTFFAEDVAFTGADASGKLILTGDSSKVYLRGKTSFETGEVVLEQDAGGSAATDIYVEDFSTIAADTLKNAATQVLTVYLANSVTGCSETQTDIVGTLSVMGPAAGVTIGTTFVFQPGGSVSANVYTSWSDLMVAFAQTKGPVIIEIDDSISPAQLPLGTWDLENRAVVVGAVQSSVVELQIGVGSSGCTLRNPAGFRNLNITNDFGTIDASPGALFFFAEDVAFTGGDTEGGLIVAGDGSRIHLRGKTSFETGDVVLEQALGASATTDVYLEDFSTIAAGTLSNSSTQVMTVYLANSVTSCSDSHPLEIGGTLTIVSPPALGGSTATTFVFRPGDMTIGNVYDDWTLLMADLALKEGPKIIEFDSSADPNTRCDIPAGTHNLQGNTVLRGRVDSSVKVLMADGAKFRDATALESGLEIWSASTDEVFTWSGARILSLRDRAQLIGGTYPGQSAPTHPLISGSFNFLDMRDQSALLAATTDQVVLETSSGFGTSYIYLFDSAVIAEAEQSFTPGQPLSAPSGANVIVNLMGQSAVFNHVPFSGLERALYSVRRERIPLVNGKFTDSAGTPMSIGGGYTPGLNDVVRQLTLQVKFRVVIETSNAAAGKEAVVDLYDVFGVLTGTPGVVTGSQIDTGTGSAPSGGPTPNPLVPSLYEADITVPFATGLWAVDFGVFEVRLSIATAGGGDFATCKHAEIILEW